MIYTSYFAKLKSLENAGIIPVAICGSIPKFYTGYWYKDLAPTYQIFAKYKQDGDSEDYMVSYSKKVLDTLDARQVVKEITAITNGAKDIALICYEKPSDFCHRHLVASWLRKNGFNCKEWDN